MKNILFVASECVPFIKTGGLADVVGSLPKYFPKEYFDVRVVIPKYAGIKEQFRNQMQYVTFLQTSFLYGSELETAVCRHFRDGI